MARAKSGKTRSEMEAAILAAATTLFARRGYYSPTLREICAQAQVSLPIVYWFFKDKRDLYIECCVRAVRTDVLGLQQATAPFTDPAEVAYAFAVRQCECHVEGDASKLLHQSLMYNDKEVLRRVKRVLFKSGAHVKANAAFAQLDGTRSPEWSMFMLASFLAGIIEHSTQWAFQRQPGRRRRRISAPEFALQGLPVLFPKVDWEAVSRRVWRAGTGKRPVAA